MHHATVAVAALLTSFQSVAALPPLTIPSVLPAGALPTVLPQGLLPVIQILTPKPPPSATNITNPAARAEAVKEAFEFAWAGYYKYAFPNDQLEPVTNTATNPRNGWGASAIDALSTALVMDIPEIVDEILAFVPTINFAVSKDNQQVSLFETTIRYIAGMLSAYDFLTTDLSKLAKNQTQVKALLDQSKNLANYLSFAFDTPTGIPSNYLYFNNRSTDGETTNVLSQIGTLILEWQRLSDLSGNKTYGELAFKGESYLLNPKPTSDEPFPGLVGSNVDINTGMFTDNEGGWVGGDDSYYEYLIKMYVYDPVRYASYKDAWTKVADSTIAHLTSHPKPKPNLTYVAEFEGTTLIETSEHLACFDGGNFLLGGMVLGRQDYINYGLALTDACHNTYASTATGIGPEIFSWDSTSVPASQTVFFQQHGFYITDAIYDLRPEVLESYYYAYQISGNKKYQDWSWDAFVAINKTCRVGSGFSEINDVNVVGGGGFGNSQETFLFAEVMKYAYLIHAPPAPWQVNYNGQNLYVFNTEAHPLRVNVTKKS